MEELARLIIGLGFVAIFINLMKNGTGGVSQWWRAKFLGRIG
jgi:hypothetical protein